MTGVSIQVVTTGLDQALRLIDGLANAPRYELMYKIGRLVQGQTRRRIEEEKTSPDGEAWKPNWKGSSILRDSGALARSIDFAPTESSVEVGTGLPNYPAIHQYGGVISAKNKESLAFMMGNRFVQVKSVTMPARPYVGLSASNEADVLDAVEDWVARLLQ